MGRHVLILNRWDDEFARYHLHVDHERHRIAYITTRDGLPVIATDLAEEVAVVEPLDHRDDVLRAARDLQQRHGRFDCLIALSEFDIETGAFLRQALGIEGQQPEEASRLRDKVTMKRCVAEAGIPVPRFAALESPYQIRRFAREVGFPLVVKPRDGAASRGVMIVASQSELDGLLRGQAMEGLECEEYIEGDIYHVDGLAVAGEILALKPAKYLNTCLDFARGRPLGSVGVDNASVVEEMASFTGRVLAALGLVTGAFHLELIRRPSPPGGEQVVFLEIGGRVGGAEIPFIWRDVYGFDLIGEWLRVQLGEPPRVPETPPGGEVAGFLIVPEPEAVPCRVIAAPSLARRVPFLYEEVLPAPGDVLDGTGGYERIGGRFRFRGGSSIQVERAVRTAMAEYRLEYQPCSLPA